MKFNNRPYTHARMYNVRERVACLFRGDYTLYAETVPLIKRLEEKEEKKGGKYIMTLEAIFHVLYKPLIIMKMDRARIDLFRWKIQYPDWKVREPYSDEKKKCCRHACEFTLIYDFNRRPICRIRFATVLVITALIRMERESWFFYRWFQQCVRWILLTQNLFSRK